MILRLFFTSILLLGSTLAFTQVTVGGAAFYDNSNYRTNKLVRNSMSTNAKEGQQVIEVNGIANYIADSYVATFNLEMQNASKQDVDQSINERLNGLKNALIHLGYTAESIKIELVDLVPAFEIQAENKFFSKSYVEKPVGFTCQKTLTIVFNKSEQLETIMSTALEYEVYDLVKVDFHVSNLKAKKEALRDKCLLELEKKIALSKRLGVKTDSASCGIDEKFDVVYPASRYFTYQAYSSSVNNVDSKKGVSATAKSTTRYYNQMEYSNYDIVENPIVTEPVVQITYSVAVDYRDGEARANNNYKILTTNGNLIDLAR